MSARLSNDGLIDGFYFARVYAYLYSDRKQSARAWARLIHAFPLIRAPPLRYTLVTYYGARVSSCYVEIAHVRVPFHGMSIVAFLAETPLPIRTASSRRSFYGNSRLAAQAGRLTSSSSSFSALADRTRRSPCAHARTHTTVIWRARENGSRTQIGTKLTSDLYHAATIYRN